MGSQTPPTIPLNGNSDKIFNAAKWLGYSINFLAKDAPELFSIDALEQGSYFSPHRTIKMSNQTQSIDVGAPVPTKYLAPDNLRIITDLRSVIGELFMCSSGDEVVKTMNADASVGAKYLGLSAEGSVNFVNNSQFKSDKQYAFLSKNISSYVASFKSYQEQTGFIHPDLLHDAAALPEWDYYNSDVVAAYREFFHEFGTHVIHVASYGWRYQLECSQSNSNSEEKSSFELNMKVKYEGFDAEAGYKQSTAYTKFNSESSVVVKAIGGPLNLANAVMNDPANLDKKATWEQEAGTKADEGLTNLRMVQLPKIFNGLSPAKTYRPITTKLAKGLFDLEKACYRTIKIPGSFLLGAGELEITSKNGNFILPEGETNEKKRKLYRPPGQLVGGVFPVKCGLGDTIEATLRCQFVDLSIGPKWSDDPLPHIVEWFPGDGSKGYAIETVNGQLRTDLPPGVPGVPDVPGMTVDVVLKYIYHPQPALGKAFWWEDDVAPV